MELFLCCHLLVTFNLGLIDKFFSRLACPKTMQFFQFDSKGNMYVYAPGAGCSGDAKLVTPGKEFLFSNNTQWEERPILSQVLDVSEESPILSQVLDVSEPPATCPVGDCARPFNEPLSKEVLSELSHKNFAPETLKKVRWVCKMYREWRAHRHGMGLEFISCDLEDRSTISASSLSFALCRFITEVKKIHGSNFPGKTLYEILVCVQFHLECLGFAFHLISDTQPFRDLKYTLDNTIKQRVADGIGVTLKQAEVLSATDEDYLWSLGFLGTSNPWQLLNTVVFCVGKAFALRAGKEHRALHAIPFDSQFKFLRDSDNEFYLRYTEDLGLKTNKGGLKHKRVSVKSVDMYATDRPECCPLHVIVKYLSLLPKG